METIRIRELAEDDNGWRAVVSFNNGMEYAVGVRDPFQEEDERRLEWYFEEYPGFPFTKAVRVRKAAESITAYGEELFRQVFVENTKVIHPYKSVEQQGLSNVQIEIAGQRRFQALHWEALKDPDAPLPLGLQAAIVRKNLEPPPLMADVKPSPTINLLVVTARPSGAQDVGYRTISRPLVEALSLKNVPLKIDILRPGTYKALEHALQSVREGYYHVAHFDMHGAVRSFSELEKARLEQQQKGWPRYQFEGRYGRPNISEYEGQRAYLLFEGEKDNSIDLVEARELANLLLSRQVPIVLLNACQSGKQVGDRETSLGNALMLAGVRLALAMGYSVNVRAAQLLMSTLYEQLFASDELVVAMRAARRELYNDKTRDGYMGYPIALEDWMLPVVYSNAPVRFQRIDFPTVQERAEYYERKAREQEYAESEPQYGFVGRDLDVLQIEKRLLTKRNILLVRGMGGAGKTTLLKHLGAWWAATGFVGQVFYYGYDEKAWTCQQIMVDIAQKLYGPQFYTNFQPLPPKAQAAMLADTLRSERHLLILDNLESITGSQLAIQHTLPPEEREALRSFLAKISISYQSSTNPAKNCTLVLLGSRGGEDWLAKGTFEQNVHDLRGLDEQAASLLVNRILERYGATQYREGEHVESFRKLIKVLDGYPLALEVVLANLRQQTPEQILEALQVGDVRLDIEQSDEKKNLFEEKTRSILHCIEYSFSNLSPEAQQLLLCLAPFTSVIWQSYIDEYTGYLRKQPVLSSLPFENWPKVLAEAQNWGLLSPHESPGFLKLQPIFPYFLRSRLNEPERAEMREAIETAFRQYYDLVGSTLCMLFAAKEAERRIGGQIVAGLEYENLSTALKLALEARTHIENLYFALARYLDSKHDLQRDFELGVSVLQSLETYPQDVLEGLLGLETAEIMGDVATKYFELKNYAGAKRVYARLLEHVSSLERTEKSLNLKAGTYHQLGRVAEEQQEWQEAEQHYRKAIEIFLENNDRYSQGDLYHQLGIVAQKQQHWQEADNYYQQALKIYGEFNDRRSQGYTYHQLGMLHAAQGNWKAATVYYNQAIQIKGEYQDWHSLANTYNQVGIMCRQQQRWKDAENFYQRALQIYIDYNDRFNQAKIYNQLGNVAAPQKDWEEAANYFLNALNIFKDYPEDPGMNIALVNLRSIWVETGNDGVLEDVAGVLQIGVEDVKKRMLEIKM